jgi:predicted nucleic acid-binding protein
MPSLGNGAAVSPMTKRTYIDANLLIAAWHGRDDAGVAAMNLLDDQDRVLLVSDALWLEVMPKAIYQRQQGEIAFYESIFQRAEQSTWQLDILRQARHLAQRYGIAAMDSIHVATALAMGADEFVSGEKPSKPMFRVDALCMISLRGHDQ